MPTEIVYPTQIPNAVKVVPGESVTFRAEMPCSIYFSPSAMAALEPAPACPVPVNTGSAVRFTFKAPVDGTVYAQLIGLGEEARSMTDDPTSGDGWMAIIATLTPVIKSSES